MNSCLSILLFLLIGISTFGQTFTEQSSISLTGVYGSSVSWGDYDNDGDLDVLLTGYNTSSSYTSKIYKNNGNNTFTEQTGIGLIPVYYSSSAWGDYDNDGDLDILLSGYSAGGNISKIYKNNGNNTFTLQTGISLVGVSNSSVAWGDYDNDGDLDILLSGSSNSSSVTKIYKNNGDNSFTDQTAIVLPGISNSAVAWGDYNNDSYLDFLLTGYSGTSYISKVYKNNGNNTFTDQSSIVLTGVFKSSVCWGDYDSDGDLDILLSGLGASNAITKLYKNNGNETFTDQTSIGLTGVYYSSCALGDYDNDGDLDIFLSGNTGTINISKVYKNMGANVFTEQSAITLTGVYRSSIALGDYDNDNDLDLILTGIAGSTAYSKIYMNGASSSNLAPSVPQNLQYNTSLKRLSWNKSSDDNTAASSISYNVTLGTTLNNDKLMSGHSNNTNGFRKIASIGNQQLDTFFYLNNSNFQYDSTYYFRVQAIDNSFKSSAFSSSVVCNSFLAGSIPLNDTSISCGTSKQLYVKVNGDTSKLSYVWSPTTGLSNPNISNPIAKPNQTTWYKVTGTSPLLHQTFTDSIKITVNPITVNAGTDISKVCGDSVTLNPSTNYSGLASNLSWSWSPTASLKLPNTKNPLAKPSITTNYIVNLISTEGCTAKDTVKVTINSMTVNAGSDVTKACGDSVTFNPTTSYAGQSTNLIWSWSPSASLNAANIKNPKAKPGVSTNYIITLTSTEGCLAKDTIKVNINPISVNAGSDLSKACGDIATLNPSTNYVGNSSNLIWLWSPSASLNSPNLKNPIAKPGVTTNYALLVTSVEGCTGRDTVKLVINPITVSGGTGMTKACGDSVQLNPTTNYPGLASNLSWSWSPGASLNASNIKNPYARPGITTTYTVTATSIEGCVGSGTTKVTIISLTVNAGTDITRICGDSAVLNPTTPYVGNPSNLIWSWNPASGLSSTNIKNPYVKSSGTANYVVNLASKEGCSATDTVKVTFSPISVNAGTDITKLCGVEANLSPTTTYPGKAANLSWTWSPSYGLNSTTSKTPIAKPGTTTSYALSLTSTEGCSAKDTIVVKITPLTLNAGSDISNTCGNSVQLNPTINYPGVATALNWNWGPTTGLTSTSIKNPYAKTKNTIKYYLNVSSTEGCTATDSIIITVTPLKITASDASKACGNVVSISSQVNSNSTTLNYVWSPATGLSNPYILSPQASPIITTTYIVSATDGVCSSTDTAVVSLTKAIYNPNFSAIQSMYTAPPFAVKFVNTTPSFSSYNYKWDFGDGNNLSSNSQNVYHTYLYNGTYTVSLIATHKTTLCSDTVVKTDYIYCVGGVSCNYSAIINQIGPMNKCAGDTVVLNCNTDPTFIYQWRLNGVSISGATNSQYIATQTGAYTVTINKSNGCSVTSMPIQINFNTLSAPQVLVNGIINPCTSDSIKLYTLLGYQTYQWSTGVTTPYLYVTQSGSYTVTVSDIFGCKANSTPFVVHTSYLNDQQICMVGVDQSSNKNIIIWEKPVSNVISGFNIYKETNAANVYTIIKTQAYSALSSYIDANSYPGTRADRYKITAIDTCGEETPISAYHKTNHLTISQGIGNNWNLNWDGYEGFAFPTYAIYRGTTLNNMAIVSSIQSNLTSYTDNPGAGVFYYKIGVVNPNTCTSSKSNESVSFSNWVSNVETGVNNTQNQISTINIYPNPNNGTFRLEVEGGFEENCLIQIHSVIGELVYSTNISAAELENKEFDVSHLSKGIYFLNLRTTGGNVVRKIVIE